MELAEFCPRGRAVRRGTPSSAGVAVAAAQASVPCRQAVVVFAPWGRISGVFLLVPERLATEFANTGYTGRRGSAGSAGGPSGRRSGSGGRARPELAVAGGARVLRRRSPRCEAAFRAVRDPCPASVPTFVSRSPPG